MLLRRSAALSLVLLSTPACDGSDASSSTNEHETLIAVSPEEFLGDVPCMAGAVSIERYVATLIDVTDSGSEAEAGASSDVGFALPSSAPIPCTETVAFAHVNQGRSYAALVDGYSNDNIEPLSPGSPTMVDRDTGALVPPVWSTQCGDPDAVGLEGPATAINRATITVHGCEPMVVAGDAPGAASLPIGDALERANLTCDGLGNVTLMDGDTLLLEDASLDCSAALEVGELSTGEHEIAVTTTDGQGGAGPRLTCTVNVVPGDISSASCTVDS